MPLVPYDDSVSPNFLAPVQPPRPETQPAVLDSAFRQENPIVGAVDWLTEPRFRADPENFSFEDRAKASEAFKIRPRSFNQVLSNEEWDWMEMKVLREAAERRVLDQAGAAGIAAQMFAGLLSPTILLPAGAIAQGGSVAGTAARTAAWAALGTAVDESILYSAQELRTGEEVAFGIGTAAVLGGLLGSAARYLTKEDYDTFEGDMVGGNPPMTIQPGAAPSALEGRVTDDEGNEVGAARMPAAGDPARQGLSAEVTDPEALAAMGIRADPMTAERPLNAGLNRAGAFLGPVTRQLEQNNSPTARWFQAQLSTAGLYLNDAAKGVTAAPKGEIKELVDMHHYKLYAALRREGEYWKTAKKTNPQLRKMSVHEFNEAVGRSLDSKGPTGFKEADEVAKIYREEVFLPMLKEFQAAGFPGFDNITPEEAQSYFSRIAKQGMILKDEETFLEIHTQNFEEGLRARAQAKINTVEARIEKLTQEADDVSLDQADAEALRAQLEAEIAKLPQEFGGKIEEVASEIRSLRRFAKQAKGKEAAQFRQEANDLEAANKELLAGFRKKENAIKGRFRTLDKTRAQLEARQEEVLGRIEKIEDMQLDTIQSAMRRAQKLLTKMQGTEGKFSAEAVKLRAQIEKAFATYAKGEERLDKMLSANSDDFMQLADSDLIPTEKVSILARRQADREQGLQRLMDDLDSIESGAPKAEVEAALTRALDNLAIAARNTNNKRAERIAKLRERAKALDPENARLKAEELRGRAGELRSNLFDDLSMRLGAGKKGETPISRSADFRRQIDNLDFSAFAREMAEDYKMKLTGESGRVPALQFLEERGSQLARTLEIDLDREWQTSTGIRKAREFYEQDVEKVVRRYLRHMAPDLELFKRFGTVNPMTKGSEIFERIKGEYDAAKKQVRENESLSEKAKEKKLAKIQSAFRQTMLDFDGEIQRLRHTRGVPSDPNAFGYRLGRFALNLNTIRAMGMVVISSVPDLGAIMLKHGLTRSLGTAFNLYTDMKTFKATREEARYAGIGLDVALGSRSSALFDILDETEHGNAVERGLQHLTNNFGKVALFDHWNREVKSLAAAITQTRIAKGLKDYAEGTISKQEIAFLAASGIDDVNARRMWKEMTETEGGADLVSGALLPNSKYWSDPELGRTYRAAIARITNSTIVTPGLERPLWMDGSMWGRIIGQFRSFTFASTQRIVMAAAQDARLGNVAQVGIGTISMLALGGLSYYLTSMFKGGDFREEMENADLDKWAFEAVVRSGVLGVLSEAQITAERIPWTQEYSTFGTEQSNRTIFDRPILNALGPSVGLIGDTEQVIVTLGDPNRGTIDAARRLTPFNNVFLGFRQLFDALEEQAADGLGVQ